ncbi:MAG TPA: tRNA dihydrouridine synthase DusB [Thermoanaerobaculia bacterium]|nr:tRNA dihydrouridine synthase DusB [Thermoanaerobaculia bacterium]
MFPTSVAYESAGTRRCAVAPPLVLAPMAGITDTTYRLLLRRLGGVGLVTMEFVSSEGLTRGNRRTERILRFEPEERPLSVQIYGADAARMARAAARVEEMQVDVCDINMGCPANKVLKGCAGAGLMRDLGKARDIIAACRKALPTTPLTVKFRLGVSDDQVNYVELGRICEGEGVAAVALHARTAKQMYTGRADWSRVARLKEAVSIPVVGNGDVNSPEDVVAMFRETGCDAVMCGRATMKNPWIFRQAADLLSGRPYRSATLEDRRDVILEHFRLIQRNDGDQPKAVLSKLRTFTGWYTHGLPSGTELRRRIQGLDSPQAFLDAVHAFFDGRDARAA